MQLSLQMYRFDGKLSPGTDFKQTLSAFVLGGYAATEALDVPPVPSAFDWVARNAQQKLETVKAALHAQVWRWLGRAGLGCAMRNSR